MNFKRTMSRMALYVEAKQKARRARRHHRSPTAAAQGYDKQKCIALDDDISASSSLYEEAWNFDCCERVGARPNLNNCSCGKSIYSKCDTSGRCKFMPIDGAIVIQFSAYSLVTLLENGRAGREWASNLKLYQPRYSINQNALGMFASSTAFRRMPGISSSSHAEIASGPSL